MRRFRQSVWRLVGDQTLRAGHRVDDLQHVRVSEGRWLPRDALHVRLDVELGDGRQAQICRCAQHLGTCQVQPGAAVENRVDRGASVAVPYGCLGAKNVARAGEDVDAGVQGAHERAGLERVNVSAFLDRQLQRRRRCIFRWRVEVVELVGACRQLVLVL